MGLLRPRQRGLKVLDTKWYGDAPGARSTRDGDTGWGRQQFWFFMAQKFGDKGLNKNLIFHYPHYGRFRGESEHPFPNCCFLWRNNLEIRDLTKIRFFTLTHLCPNCFAILAKIRSQYRGKNGDNHWITVQLSSQEYTRKVNTDVVVSRSSSSGSSWSTVIIAAVSTSSSLPTRSCQRNGTSYLIPGMVGCISLVHRAFEYLGPFGVLWVHLTRHKNCV